MNWVQINIKVNDDFRYMKIHIFALRWRDEIKRSLQLSILSISYIDTFKANSRVFMRYRQKKGSWVVDLRMSQ